MYYTVIIQNTIKLIELLNLLKQLVHNVCMYIYLPTK